MAHPDIIRAWKDEEYRAGLSEAERAGLPANPAGLVELSEADIDQAAGGTTWTATFTYTGVDFTCFPPPYTLTWRYVTCPANEE